MSELSERGGPELRSGPVLPPPGRVDLMGVGVDPLDFEAAVDAVVRLVGTPGLAHVVTANVDFLAQASRDELLASILTQADLVVADGVPLLWMARWSGTPLPSRVNGTDLVERLLQVGGARGWRVCMVGGDPGVVDLAARSAHDRWGAHVVGTWPLPLSEANDPAASARVASEIGAADADLILMVMRAGRQERWINAHRHLMGNGVVIGVGSALDFVAGARRRAPVALQRSGFEWAWRLALEPRRLWRRYLVDGLGLLIRFAATRLVSRSA
jgi:N-acetylglucosaminyldiphosphoundecaprenol N-acetyl-beta-D-mannosaminyltransferase